MPLRIVFFGTPAFAVPSLEALAESGHHVIAVVTQPDRPRGRGQRIVAAPVKAAAIARGIPVMQPERLKDPAWLDRFRALGADLGIVAAYGKILPAALLSVPPLGLLNVHASLLPRWRGAAPVHRAILAGDRITGITIMRVVLALDAGPMLDRVEVEIAPDETSGELESRLAIAGAALLRETVDRVAASLADASRAGVEIPQDDSLVTYAARLERSESPIDWTRPAQAVHDQVRGLQPWPLASTLLAGRRLLIRRTSVANHGGRSAAPGTVIDVEKDALLVAAGAGVLRVLTVQLEGRTPVNVGAFLNGHPVSRGDRFDPPQATTA